MANDFKIVLSAAVNPEQLKKELDNFFGSYKAQILTNGSSTGSSSSSSNSNSSKMKFDDEMKYIAAQDKANQMNQKFDADRIKREQEYIAMQEEANLMNQNYDKSKIKAEQDYANMLNQAYAQNQKIDDAKIADQEKLNQEFAKYQQQVDIFMTKNQNRDWNKPGASEALGVRTDMQGVLNGTVTPEAVERLSELKNEAKLVDANFQGLNVTTKTFGSQLMDGIKSMAQAAIGIGLVYSALNELKQGFQYIIDLSKEMNNIRVLQVDGAKSAEDINNLATSYNNLAQELSVTTKEVAQGSVEWLRQGKSISETQELVRSTMMLSKLGALEAGEATNDLTSIMNGYALETKDAEGIVSKLVAVDNVAATSAGKDLPEYMETYREITLDRIEHICYY